MKGMSNMLKDSPMVQMKSIGGSGDINRFGDSNFTPNIVFNPNQINVNQMKTSLQVMNYESSKNMDSQGRTDMRGNIVGYSDTMG